MELVSFVLSHGEKKSVSVLAKELNRKQEAISRDAGILEKFSLVKKIQKKTAGLPQTALQFPENRACQLTIVPIPKANFLILLTPFIIEEKTN